MQALKTSPKGSKVHFSPHFNDKNLRQRYRINYFKFIRVEFAIKLPIFIKNRTWSEITCFNSSESYKKGILTKLNYQLQFNFLFCVFKST